ncbi:MAG: YIP1 family protein [Methanomicrobiales archaeon]
MYFVLLFLLYLVLSYIVFALGTLFLPIGPPGDLPVLFMPHILLQLLPLTLLPIYLGLLHGWVYALGGRGGFSQTVKSVLYGLTPLLLLGYFSPLFLIAGIWSLGLITLGLRELRGMSLGKAGLATLLPSIFLVVLIFILFLSAL